MNLVTDPDDQTRVQEVANPLDCSYQVTMPSKPNMPKHKKYIDEHVPDTASATKREFKPSFLSVNNIATDTTGFKQFDIDLEP